METFTQTCSKDYSRHHYSVVNKDGTNKMFSSWELAQSYWWHTNKLGTLSHIDVVDHNSQKTSTKGFGG
jgi:hypothetical protein